MAAEYRRTGHFERSPVLSPSPARGRGAGGGRVLEIGCGTGLLTRALLPRLGGTWLVTDLAPAMIAAARTRVADPRASFRVMDGEHPDCDGGFDLVVSSLAAQWFTELGPALARLRLCLRPGGVLAVTTLGAGSLGEWAAALHGLGLPGGPPAYPDAAALLAMMPGAAVIAEDVAVRYGDGHAFLAALKAIGAGTPVPGHRPLPAGSLRRALAALGSPCTVTYRLLTLIAIAE
ncbi:MAG: methyltransferase domain-containing protein [Magnetospirillum sp.]|nr:methyltransferase domain-containing protein [Magnetospirillum sp.]